LTRVLDEAGAVRAAFDLHDRGRATSADSLLLRAAGELSGGAAAPIYVLNVNQVAPNSGTLAADDSVRIGAGSESEYRKAAIVHPASDATHVPLAFPLSRTHDSTVAPVTVDDINRVLAAAPNAFQLSE